MIIITFMTWNDRDLIKYWKHGNKNRKKKSHSCLFNIADNTKFLRFWKWKVIKSIDWTDILPWNCCDFGDKPRNFDGGVLRIWKRWMYLHANPLRLTFLCPFSMYVGELKNNLLFVSFKLYQLNHVYFSHWNDL
jgi:hypothetical protein